MSGARAALAAIVLAAAAALGALGARRRACLALRRLRATSTLARRSPTPSPAATSLAALVLEQLRLPRAALGATVGFSLGLAGAAMQGLLRNPLADPGVVGVSGGAAFGAVVVFYSGLAGVFALALAARRRRRRDRRRAGAVRARRPRRRHDDADPRRGDDQQLRRRADRAGAQPFAQPLRRLRNHVLADGLARRPQPAAIVAGAAADARRLGAAAGERRRRSTR